MDILAKDCVQKEHAPSLHQEKKRLRALLRSRRRGLSPADVKEKSQHIFEQLRAFDPFQKAQTIACYSANENEVLTAAIWQGALTQGKAVYYPRITGDRTDLEFVRRYPGERLVPGTFGILIPPGENLLSREQAADLVLVPGVGFDRQGHRLGRGRGYYDRALRGVLAGALRVALSYEFQLMPEIPVGPQDEAVQYIITETGLISCSAQNLSSLRLF